MAIFLTCVRPHAGEIWQLEKGDDGLVLQADEKVEMVIANAEASLKIHLPSFFGSRYITVDLPGGNLICFEANAENVAQVRSLLDECFKQNPDGAAKAFNRKGNRDLLIGIVSMFLGFVITFWSMTATAQGGNFVVMTGLLGIGLIEVVRGIYFKTKAGSAGVLGFIVLLFGMVTLIWAGYNFFIHNGPKAPGQNPFFALGVSAAMIYVGIKWIRGKRAK